MKALLLLGLTLLFVSLISTSSFAVTVLYSDAESPSGADAVALNTSAFAITWCDSTSTDVHLKYFYTNGTNYTSTIDVDSTAGTCANGNTQSITLLNSTHLVITYIDGAETDYTAKIYDFAGNMLIQGDIDTSVSTTIHISDVTPINNTHFATLYINGTGVNNTILSIVSIADPTINTKKWIASIGADGSLAMTTFNSTRFGVVLVNATGTNLIYSVWDDTLTQIGSTITIDADIGPTTGHGVDIASWNSTHVVITWFDDTSDNKQFAVYTSSGTQIVAPTVIETTGSNTRGVSVTMLDTTRFAIAFLNSTSQKYALYYTNGTNIMKGVSRGNNFNTNTALRAISWNQYTNIGFCYQNWVHLFLNATSSGMFTTYKSDGTSWNGVCNSPPTIDSEVEPTDPSTYVWNGNYTFKANISDADLVADIDKVFLEFGGTNYTITNYINIDADTNEYNYTFNNIPAQSATAWKWYANDSQNVWASGTGGTWTLNKATLQMTISGADVTYPTAVAIAASESNSGDSDVVYRLWRNTTNTQNGSSLTDTTVYAASGYLFLYNSSGGANYSANNTGVSVTVTVNQGTPNVKTYINNATTNYTGTYPFSIEVRGNSTTIIAPPTFNLYVSGSTASGNPSVITASEGYGTYNVVYNTSGNTNWTSASNSTLYLIVNKGTTSINLTIDGSNANKTYETGNVTGQSINITAISNITGLTVNLNFSHPSFTNTSAITSVTNTTTYYMLGYYQVNASTNGNTNYSGSSTVYYINLSDTIAPNATNFILSNTTIGQQDKINVSADVIDNSTIGSVIAQITRPLVTGTETVNRTMSYLSGNTYYVEMSGGDTVIGGTYTIDYIFTTDTATYVATNSKSTATALTFTVSGTGSTGGEIIGGGGGGGGVTQFGPPVETFVNITSESVCGNGVCEASEDVLTCSSDCKPRVSEAWAVQLFILVIVGTVVLLALDHYGVFKLGKKKKSAFRHKS